MPRPHFTQSTRNTKLRFFRTSWQVFSTLFKNTPVTFCFVIFLAFVMASLPVANTYLLTKLFGAADDFSNGITAQSIVTLLAATLVSFVAFRLFVEVINEAVCDILFSERNRRLLNLKLGEKCADLALITYEDPDKLNMLTRAKECVIHDRIIEVYYAFSSMLVAVISVGGSATILCAYSIWFLPLSILSVFPFFIIRLVRGKKFYRMKRFQAKGIRKRDYLWKLFSNKQAAKEMRVMGFDDYLTDEWARSRDSIIYEEWKFNIKDARIRMYCEFLKIACYAASIAMSIYLVVIGQISLGIFGACLSAFASMQGEAMFFTWQLGRLPEMLAFSQDYFEFFDLTSEKERPILQNFEQNIQLKEVSFSYPQREQKAVNNVTLDIRRGEKIAVLGINGSGKTTLSKLILGLYEVDSGQILYDGVDLTTINRQNLYKNVSTITQDFIKYSFTLRENIAISKTDEIDNTKRIEKLLHDVALSDLIDPQNGLDYIMGREFNGRELSGGQWQKIAIARALFKNSDFIILDEPTSALDPLIETEILSKFIEIAKDKTAIIISHRVGLCKLVDKIVVMKDGEIAEYGTHDSLIGSNGEYAKLYNSQAYWYNT